MRLLGVSKSETDQVRRVYFRLENALRRVMASMIYGVPSERRTNRGDLGAGKISDFKRQLEISPVLFYNGIADDIDFNKSSCRIIENKKIFLLQVSNIEDFEKKFKSTYFYIRSRHDFSYTYNKSDDGSGFVCIEMVSTPKHFPSTLRVIPKLCALSSCTIIKPFSVMRPTDEKSAREYDRVARTSIPNESIVYIRKNAKSLYSKESAAYVDKFGIAESDPVVEECSVPVQEQPSKSKADTILEGIEGYIKSSVVDIDSNIERVEKRVDELKGELSDAYREIAELKALKEKIFNKYSTNIRWW